MQRSKNGLAPRLVVTLIAAMLALTAHADITKGQAKEEAAVWKVVESLLSDWMTGAEMSKVYEGVHPDFVFWNDQTPVPGDRATAFAYDDAGQKFGNAPVAQVVDIVPLQIKVVDDVAIVQSYIRGFWKVPDGTPAQLFHMRYHGTWKKHGGRWMQLANYMER